MKSRIIALEGLRGVAAIIVVIWHSILAFSPETSGIFPKFSSEFSFIGNPFFVFMNGTGAVVLFFVLSGFVLSRSAFVQNSYNIVLTNMMLRYPRLAVPVVISTLLSWALFDHKLMYFSTAAKISGSPWLEKFGYAYDQPFVPVFFDALSQGLFFTFYRGDSYYNSSLWTMRYEFFGSMITFVSVLVILKFQRFYPKFIPIFFVFLALFAFYISPWYLPFVVGLVLSRYLPNQFYYHNIFKKIGFFLLLIISLYMLGYHSPIGIYSIFNHIDRIFINSIGAMLLIAILTYVSPVGIYQKISIILGKVSFPLYLIHLSIICSLNSFIYIKFHDLGLSVYSVILFSVFSSMLLSIPLMVLNDVWVRYLKRVSFRL